MRQSLSDYESVIAARGLMKQYGRVHALNGLDLSVQRGEVHGFLGPNGAGKSTTIRALLGQIRLDDGTAQVFGADAWHDSVAIHRRLAYVPGDTNLWPGLTGTECINTLGALSGTLNEARRDELIERFQLDPSRRSSGYSKGNRQKVALIAALACDVELLLLDEPTSGLDPLMESVFQDCVREAQQRGQTVLLSSHILAEVEALCDQVSIIRDGALVSVGTIADLRIGTLTTVAATVQGSVEQLHTMPGVSQLEEYPLDGATHLTFQVTCDALATAVGCVARANPRQLSVTPPSLEELFRDVYQPEASIGSPQ